MSDFNTLITMIDEDQYSKNSGTLEEYHIQNSWDSKDDLHEHLVSSYGLISHTQNKQNDSVNNIYGCNEACLVLTVPPENRFRYRYDTEMSGTHGSLQGVKAGREKSVPTVELLNYPFEALIRVTLATCREKDEHYPHPHSLFVKEKLYQKKIYTNWDKKHLTKTGHYSDPHYIKVGVTKNDFTARFEGMCIINSKKENFYSSIKEKVLARHLEQIKYGYSKFNDLKQDEIEMLIRRRAETAVCSVDVDFVSLCFEAFREEDGKLFPICQPIFSEPIGNAKSAKTGKLKISRINKCSGSCKGGDEIWLLVEKINKKGLIVRFSEECNGNIVWESCIEGDDLILHHQYAIIFKTPPFRDINIPTEVEVLMRLERTTQPNQPCDYSEPITFVYEPLKSKNSKGDNLCRKESILTSFKQTQTKRSRTDSSCSPFICHRKRKTDDLEFENMSFEVSDGDIEQLLLDGKEDTFELDQAWAKFNVEEFLKFISSEDVDMPLQKDGISTNSKHRRDFLYKLYTLYSKLDENDIKKLTDQISNFRVSKKKVSDQKIGLEKDQVKDAASTLLSLRSKAMVNNSCNQIKNQIGKTEESEEGRECFQSKKKVGSLTLDSPSEPDLEGRSPVPTSVIKFSFPKSKVNFDKSSKTNFSLNSDDIELPPAVEKQKPVENSCFKGIKQELELNERISELEKLDLICEILNRNGSWKNLAEMWNYSSAISSARNSLNPAKYILECIEEIHGSIDLKALRALMDGINEKKVVDILDEILAKKC